MEDSISSSSKEDNISKPEELDAINQLPPTYDGEKQVLDSEPPKDTSTMIGCSEEDLEQKQKSNVASSRDVTGKHSSFAQLVRTWETYMSDGTGRQFEPLHVFQQLNLCGPEDGLARLTDAYTTYQYSSDYADLNQPYGFRHTHSTPSQQTPSILDDEDEDEPPPYGLEILSRSRSTPLSTSANSAFGRIHKTNPYKYYASDRSAFTLPLHRSSSGSTQNIARQTTFNPIRHDKDLEAEMTSIEVMDVPASPSLDEKPGSKSIETTPARVSESNKASGLTARFLSDVSKNFRRRYIHRGGRDNPARPPSTSDESSKKKGDEDTISSKSSASTSLRCPIHKAENQACATSKSVHENNAPLACEMETTKLMNDAPYQELDSDLDDDGDGVPFTNNYVSVDSPATVSSPPYHHIHEDHQGSGQVNRVSIQVSTSVREPALDHNRLYAAHSPEPSQLAAADCTTEASISNDSQGGSRCSATTHTSGHTTHATSTTNSSGQLTHLSAISETDREVMEALKAGKLLSEAQGTSNGTKGDSLTKSIPLSRNARYRNYVALPDSPVDLREGANVPADRFFTLPDSHRSEKRVPGAKTKNQALSKKISSLSPTTVSNGSMTTNSSASSTADAPPTFVSYLDRKLTSDLSFMRESVESSSPRGDDSKSEQRESSPAAEMLGYSDVVFEEAKAPRNGQAASKKPRPIWPTNGFHFGRRVRSLPPRSPHKGLRTPTTPPPPGSVSPAYNCLSPPRNIVDHRIDPNVSKPSAVIRRPVSSRLAVVQNVRPDMEPSSQHVVYNRVSDESSCQGGHEVVRIGTGYDSCQHRVQRGPSPLGYRSRTYNEHNIEILKTDSKEDSSPTLLY